MHSGGKTQHLKQKPTLCDLVQSRMITWFYDITTCCVVPSIYPYFLILHHPKQKKKGQNHNYQ